MKLNWKVRLQFVIFSLALCSCPLVAQECGTVLNKETNSPVSGVHIYLKGDQLVAITNEEGQFCLQQSVEIGTKDLLTFSHVSYSKQELSLNDLQSHESTIFLTEDRHQLGEVIIQSENLLDGKVRYKKLTPMKYGLYSFGSVLAGDYIYVMGGDETRKDEIRDMQNGNYTSRILNSGMSLMSPWEGYNNRMFRYDIRRDKWEVVDQKFRKRAYHSIHHYNDKIYILGGKRLSPNRKLEYLDETVEIYDLKRDTVLVDPINPHQAVDFASFMYDGNIIVMGGSTKMSRKGTRLYTNKVHSFDLKTGLWYELPKMPEAKETQGTVIDDYIYMLGGRMKGKKATSQIERYNIAEGKIETVGELLYEVERPAIASDGNVIFIFEDDIIQTYNTATGERYAYQIDLDLKGSDMFYTDGKLYILGGYDYDEYGKRSSSDLYSIEINEFNRTRLYTTDK